MNAISDDVLLSLSTNELQRWMERTRDTAAEMRVIADQAAELARQLELLARHAGAISGHAVYAWVNHERSMAPEPPAG